MKVVAVLCLMMVSCAYEEANIPKAIAAVTSDTETQQFLGTVKVEYVAWASSVCGGPILGSDLRLHNAMGCYHSEDNSIIVATMNHDATQERPNYPAFRYPDEIQMTLQHEMTHAVQYHKYHRTWHPIERTTPPEK